MNMRFACNLPRRTALQAALDSDRVRNAAEVIEANCGCCGGNERAENESPRRISIFGERAESQRIRVRESA